MENQATPRQHLIKHRVESTAKVWTKYIFESLTDFLPL